MDSKSIDKLKVLAKTKLKKPTAVKLKQIKQREKLRRIGLELSLATPKHPS